MFVRYTIVSCSIKINFISVGDFFSTWTNLVVKSKKSINPPKRGRKLRQDDTGIETDDFFLSALPQFEPKKGRNPMRETPSIAGRCMVPG